MTSPKELVLLWWTLWRLRSSKAETRRRGLREIGFAEGKRVIEALIRVLADPDASLRYGAAWRLGRRGNTRAVEPLVTMLAYEEDPSARGGAIQALGVIGDRGGIDPLLGMLSDKKQMVKAVASLANILQRCESPESQISTVSKLIRMLIDSDDAVRVGAVFALSLVTSMQRCDLPKWDRQDLVAKLILGLPRSHDGFDLEDALDELNELEWNKIDLSDVEQALAETAERPDRLGGARLHPLLGNGGRIGPRTRRSVV